MRTRAASPSTAPAASDSVVAMRELHRTVGPVGYVQKRYTDRYMQIDASF
jgi:hypothetical protein